MDYELEMIATITYWVIEFLELLRMTVKYGTKSPTTSSAIYMSSFAPYLALG